LQQGLLQALYIRNSVTAMKNN